MGGAGSLAAVEYAWDCAEALTVAILTRATVRGVLTRLGEVMEHSLCSSTFKVQSVVQPNVVPGGTKVEIVWSDSR